MPSAADDTPAPLNHGTTITMTGGRSNSFSSGSVEPTSTSAAAGANPTIMTTDNYLRPPTDNHNALYRARSGSSGAASDRFSHLARVISSGREDQLSMAPRTSGSVSSHFSRSTVSTRFENRHSQREVRSLPPWIDSFEANSQLEAQVPATVETSLLSPARAHAAHHNSAPARTERRISQDGYVDYDDVSDGTWEKVHERGLFGGTREPERGRKWDHAREHTPVIMQSASPGTSASVWSNFIRASRYGPSLDEDGARVDEKFLREQTPGYDRPWCGDAGGDDSENALMFFKSKKERRRWYKRCQQTLLTHPLVPLFFRLIVLTTSTIALGLSGSIYQFSKENYYPEHPSTTMAIVVDVVAIPYICYITWDEYTGKPLGLRSPKAKIRLVLLDLFFIIFESANIALAFDSLTDTTGSCTPGGEDGVDNNICNRVKTLCGILLLALIAWSSTFSVSIFRLVERVGGRED